MQDLSSDFSRPPSIKTQGFWTPGRIVLTLIGVALIGAFGLSSCNSTETNNTNGSRVVATSSSPGNGTSPRSNPPAPNNPPAAFVSLPEQVRDTKVETLE